MDEISDEESGDVPFNSANNAPQTNADENQADQEDQEEAEDDEDEEGVQVRLTRNR